MYLSEKPPQRPARFSVRDAAARRKGGSIVARAAEEWEVGRGGFSRAPRRTAGVRNALAARAAPNRTSGGGADACVGLPGMDLAQDGGASGRCPISDGRQAKLLGRGAARLALAAAHEARLTPRELDELTLHRIKAEMALKRSRESKALQRCKDAIRASRTTIVDGLFSG